MKPETSTKREASPKVEAPGQNLVPVGSADNDVEAVVEVSSRTKGFVPEEIGCADEGGVALTVVGPICNEEEMYADLGDIIDLGSAEL